MPSKRKVRAFKPVQGSQKAHTEVQRAYLNHQQWNIQDVQASGSHLSHEAKRGRYSSPPGEIPPNPQHEPQDGQDVLQEYEGFDMDLDGTGPHDLEDDPVLLALNRASHDAARLEGVNRWEREYPHMLESFLQCRQKTNNWGNSLLWDHDFHQPCLCGSNQGTTREVVLVDILCE